MARRYSHMERPPPHPPPSYVHTRTTPSLHTVMHMRQTYNRSVWSPVSLSQTCRKKHFSVITQYKRVRPITCKPKHQDSSCFPLFILCTRIIKIFVLCWCVHIAYVSIWCPVDIVVLNLDFTDLCGFYITCGVGEKRGRFGGWELFVFYNGCSKLFIGRSIHPLLGTL